VQATQLTGGAPWGAVGEFEGDVGVREESQSRIIDVGSRASTTRHKCRVIATAQ